MCLNRLRDNENKWNLIGWRQNLKYDLIKSSTVLCLNKYKILNIMLCSCVNWYKNCCVSGRIGFCKEINSFRKYQLLEWREPTLMYFFFHLSYQRLVKSIFQTSINHDYKYLHFVNNKIAHDNVYWITSLLHRRSQTYYTRYFILK